jgi:hypothetical protein
MQEKLKQQVLNTFLLVMRPIVRILLRYGIGYREFVEVVKTAFVDVASSDFGLRGRPTNISRVAVMTGLTRKEVKRLRDKLSSGDTIIAVKTTPLADVLHHWHAQAEFTDSSGRPRALSFSAEKDSFAELVRRYGGDVPPGAMRTELNRVGAIVEDENGRLRATQRGFRPDRRHENLLTLLVHGAYAMLSNIAHNTDTARSEGSWAHRIAFTRSVQGGEKRQLRRIAKDRIIEFSESVDDIFMTYEALQDTETESQERDAIAVGVFYFEEHDKNAKYEW